MVIQLNDENGTRLLETTLAPADGWVVTAWTRYFLPGPNGFSSPSEPQESYFVSTLLELVAFVKQWAEENLRNKDYLPPLPQPTGEEEEWHGDLRTFHWPGGRVHAAYARKVTRGSSL